MKVNVHFPHSGAVANGCPERTLYSTQDTHTQTHGTPLLMGCIKHTKSDLDYMSRERLSPR